MKSTIFVLILVLVSLFMVKIISSDSVIDLTEYSLEEFKSELENHDSIFVKFYVPSCPHCKAISADYSSTASKLNSEDLAVPLAEVDCSREPEGRKICHKFNIKGYPTLKLFKSGHLFKDYNGRRDTKSMVNWLKVYAIDRSSKLTSLMQLKSLLEQEQTVGDKTMVIGIFKSRQEKAFDKWTKSLKKVTDCKSLSHIKFWTLFYDHSTVDSRILLASLPLQLRTIASKVTPNHLAVPFVAMYRDEKFINSSFESVIYIFKKLMFNSHELHQWIVTNAHGLVAIRTPEIDSTALRPGKVGDALSLCYPFDFKNEPEFSHKWRNQLLPLAITHSDIFFAICHSDLYQSEKCNPSKFNFSCSRNQLTDETWPLVYLTDSIGLEYRMDQLGENVSHELSELIDKFKSGQMKHILPFQEPRAGIDFLHEKFPLVRQVTNKNVKRAISLEPRPILLSIYNSTNSTGPVMRSLFQNLTQVAHSLDKLNYSLVVAAMDSETNVMPMELQFKLSSAIYLTILEREERNGWKEISRFRGQAKNGADSLVSFVLGALNSKKVDVNGKETLENLHHKSRRERIKSEL